MCGRFTLRQSPAAIRDQFDLDAVPAIEPRYNISPTQSILAVRQTDEKKEAAFLRGGLVPSGASELPIGNRLLNARAETAAEKPSFRSAFKHRRCLIVVDGFYEWQTVAGKKHPVHFRFHDGRLFAFAGLWEYWKAPDGLTVETCTILTTSSNALIRPLHDRMPVILPPVHYQAWLDPHFADKATLQSWMIPWPAQE